MPPVAQTRSRHEAGGTATASPSLSNRPSIQIGDLAVGCIVWLPSRNSEESIHCVKDDCCSKQELNDGGYNHPVVVLKANEDRFGNVFCSIAQVTSKERYDRTDRIRISQEEPTQRLHSGNDDVTVLYLEHGEMDKQSFVVVDHIYRVPVSQLRTLSFRSIGRAFDSRLRKQSYALLMKLFGLEPEDWVDTLGLGHSISNSREPLRRHSRQQSQTSESNDDYFIIQGPPQQSPQALQAGRAARTPISPVVGTSPGHSLPYRYYGANPPLANYPDRIPREWQPQSVNPVSHYAEYGRYRQGGSNYGTYSGHQQFEERERVPLAEDGNNGVKTFLRIAVSAVGTLGILGIWAWRRWQGR